MPRLRRRTTALVIAVCLSCAGMLAARPTPGEALADPASRALAYLVSSLQSNGSLDDSVNETADLAMGLAAAGFDPKTVATPSPSSNLCSQLPLETTLADTGDLAAAILGLEAAGIAPASCSSGALTQLTVTDYGVTAAGAYGDGETFTQSLAILAQESAGLTPPAGSLTYLLSIQDGGGGFNYQEPSATVGAPSDDSNSTAMALMALNAAHDTAANSAAITWLQTSGIQGADGGFQYQNTYGSDPDSTALVIEAIVATGGNPDSAPWTSGATGPMTYLLSTQATNGGFIYPGNTTPDTLTTSQVPLGLLNAVMPVTAPTATGITPASLAQDELESVDYLAAQQNSTGGITGDSGDAIAEQTVIAAADTGADPNTITDGGSISLVAHLEADAATDSAASAGSDADLIMAAIAAHDSPSNFGGVDLLTVLSGDQNLSTGAYGDGETFTQSLAILALVDAGITPPANALTYLLGAENTTGADAGGWGYTGISNDLGIGSDSNSTAVALMALNAAGTTTANAAALGWLHTSGIQGTDGGFQYQTGDGTDPDSTALVIEAIIATGGNPEAAPWTNGGTSPTAALLSFQASDGGFIEPGNTGPDAFTTSEVPLALLRVSMPASAVYAAGTTLASLSPTTGTTHNSAGGVTSVPVPFTGGTLGAQQPRSGDDLTGNSSAPVDWPRAVAWAALLAVMGCGLVIGVGTARRRSIR